MSCMNFQAEAEAKAAQEAAEAKGWDVYEFCDAISFIKKDNTAKAEAEAKAEEKKVSEKNWTSTCVMTYYCRRCGRPYYSSYVDGICNGCLNNIGQTP